jgi:hypothetical protein
MDSEALRQYGFTAWARFNKASERELLSKAPRLPGVYSIRLLGPRLQLAQATSDLVYIGSAAGHAGLQLRLRQYFHPGPTQRTNRRLLAVCGESDLYEIAFVVLESGDAAKLLEAQLLHGFLGDHCQLPRENRQLPTRTTAPDRPMAELWVACLQCDRRVPLDESIMHSLRTRAAAGPNEPIGSVWQQVGPCLRCTACGAGGAALVTAAGQSLFVAGPRSVQDGPNRVPTWSSAEAANLDDVDRQDDEHEGGWSEYDEYRSEAARYDEDADEHFDLDDDDSSEQAAWSGDNFDDKDDWS